MNPASYFAGTIPDSILAVTLGKSEHCRSLSDQAIL